MNARIALGGIFHETNTFLKKTTHEDVFDRFYGNEIFSLQGNRSPISGFLEFAESQNWEITPTTYFRGRPSGTVDANVVETFWNEMKCRLPQNFDAVFLVLHGAMVSNHLDDVEGEILIRLHNHFGRAVPVFGVLDLHANFTQAMADHSTCLSAYRKNPHTDAFETSLRAARTLAWKLDAAAHLKTSWHHSRCILPPLHTGTKDDPMYSLEQRARKFEREYDEVYAVNIFAGFAHADTPNSGVSYSIIHSYPSRSSLIAHIFSHLDECLMKKWPGLDTEPNLNDVVVKILREQKFPAAIVETADNIGGGTPGDNTCVLRTLLEYPVESAGIILNDPESVNQLQKHAPGDSLRVSLGGKSGELGAEPLELEVELVRLSSGYFTLEDPHSHLASSIGHKISMGPCAVVRHRGFTILLTSKPTPPFDLGQWSSQGIDPRNFQIINIKAAVAHRQAYDPICRAQYYVDTPGPCSSNLKSLPYRKLKRPIWPLDSISQPA